MVINIISIIERISHVDPLTMLFAKPSAALQDPGPFTPMLLCYAHDRVPPLHSPIVCYNKICKYLLVQRIIRVAISDHN